MASNHLYLVDGSGYIFRAYHRLPPLTNRHGQPAGAVYGFTTMLWKLVEDLQKPVLSNAAGGVEGADGPTHLAVIFDAASKTFRNDMYDGYKAHRPPPPEDLVPQFPMIRTATRAFSVPCIEEDGLEADDVIACYAKAALKAGWAVTIVSSDKDLMQLIEEPGEGHGGLDMLDTMANRRIGRAEVIEKFGVPPEQLGDVLALMGDAVDNVPGVPGIGPKTASQLIQEHGSVEAVLAAAETIAKPKLRQSLIDHADAARMSRELVRLVCDKPLTQPLDELAIMGIPPEPLRAFLVDQGFRSLVGRLGQTDVADSAPPEPVSENEPPFVHKDYVTITDEATLDQWIAAAHAQGFVAIDTETDHIDAVKAALVGVSLALAPGVAAYLPILHSTADDLLGERPHQIDCDVALAKLKPLLEDPAVLKIGQNIKYDIIMFHRRGIDVAPHDDTMLISYDLDAGTGSHGMDDLCRRHLGHQAIAFKDVCGSGKTQISFDRVPLEQATHYAAEDADVTLRLWKRLKPRLAKEAATTVYEMVDRPLVPVIARMEMAGIAVDRAELKRLSAQFTDEIARLEEQVFEAAGGPFTIGSPKQLGEVLFDRLGLKGGRKGKTGVYSTDVTELERLAAGDVPVARLVLDWRQLTKLKNTYTDALQEQINPETGRVHTSFSMAVAQTGRLSSTDPNLQNIPIRTEIGRQIRHAFVAEPGNVILSADYSQIELRLAAHMADVPQLRHAFAAGTDIHNLTATELFGEVNRETRGRAKTINFAILYGISAFGLAGRLGVDRGEAQAIIDRYFDRFPGVRNYIAATIEQVRDKGFVTTLFGRKTHLPGIKSKQMNERQSAERQAINAPIQGTCADIIKRAMVRMEPVLAAAGLGSCRMLLQVHDELVFEVPQAQAEAAREVIRTVMAGAAEPAITLSVPLGIEVGIGASWGAAH